MNMSAVSEKAVRDFARLGSNGKVAQTFLSVPKECRLHRTDKNVCAT
jgi:hypothetical protein